MAANMRMNKSGSFSAPASTLVKVTGWVADGAYPSTVITSDALVLSQSGAGITVSGACAYTNTFSTSVTAQLYKNGTAFGSIQTLGGSSNTFTWSLTGQAVAAGDTWDMRVQELGGFNGLTVNAAGTFLRVDGYIDPRPKLYNPTRDRASLY